jgi:hypothetical protein
MSELFDVAWRAIRIHETAASPKTRHASRRCAWQRRKLSIIFLPPNGPNQSRYPRIVVDFSGREAIRSYSTLRRDDPIRELGSLGAPTRRASRRCARQPGQTPILLAPPGVPRRSRCLGLPWMILLVAKQAGAIRRPFGRYRSNRDW